MSSDNYTPQKYGKNHFTFLLRTQKCKTCNKDMIVKPKDNRETFPYYVRNDFDAQSKRCGLVYRSNIKVDDSYICIKCEQAGEASFECALCNERKSSEKKHKSYGDPPEFLCTDCYETVPAKVWEEKESELYDEHKYDFC